MENYYERVMLENKQIVIGDKEYRLTIEKERLPYTSEIGFKAYLSDVNSQYTNEKYFKSTSHLEKDLKNWIIQSDLLNNPETRFFNTLKDWDGVVHIE